MFQSARLKLTAWYLLFIMLVSITFSFAFYRESTLTIQRVIVRIHSIQQQSQQLMIPPPPEAEIILEQLQEEKIRVVIALAIVNGIILIVAGGAGYFLAGRTLRPIQKMVDEQNQFISDASHELRTPIATLRAEMEASLLEKHLSDKEARKLIVSNLEELGTLQELTNSLLQLAHVHKKDEKFNETISLQEVLQTANKKVAPMAKKKHITFSLPQFEGQVKGDKHSMVEVFVNLFDNAIKYSEDKKTVTVTASMKKRMIVLLVKDEGWGIAPTDLQHIFDRFYRADKSRSLADGHGLGLSIAKKIVIAHGGTITATSSFQKGTTFTVTFPLVG